MKTTCVSRVVSKNWHANKNHLLFVPQLPMLLDITNETGCWIPSVLLFTISFHRVPNHWSILWLVILSTTTSSVSGHRDYTRRPEPRPSFSSPFLFGHLSHKNAKQHIFSGQSQPPTHLYFQPGKMPSTAVGLRDSVFLLSAQEDWLVRDTPPSTPHPWVFLKCPWPTSSTFGTPKLWGLICLTSRRASPYFSQCSIIESPHKAAEKIANISSRTRLMTLF